MNEKRTGGIKRSVRDLSVYRDAFIMPVFLHILLTVNEKDEQWQGHTVHAGETLTSAFCIAGELGMDVNKVEYALLLLKARGLITEENIEPWRIITVIDIEKYVWL